MPYCEVYRPGHCPHWIQARLEQHGPTTRVRLVTAPVVTATVEIDGGIEEWSFHLCDTTASALLRWQAGAAAHLRSKGLLAVETADGFACAYPSRPGQAYEPCRPAPEGISAP